MQKVKKEEPLGETSYKDLKNTGYGARNHWSEQHRYGYNHITLGIINTQRTFNGSNNNNNNNNTLMEMVKIQE